MIEQILIGVFISFVAGLLVRLATPYARKPFRSVVRFVMESVTVLISRIYLRNLF